MRILLVEDNRDLAKLVTEGLQRASMLVDTFHGVNGARAALAAMSFSAIVLDLGLPDENGIVLLHELRRRGDMIPILILTARDGVQDRVAALQAGAADYVTKPFAMEELVMRLHVLLRRQSVLPDREVVVGNVSLDTSSRQISTGEARDALSPRETAILKMLMQSTGKVVHRDRLQSSNERGSNAVDVAVHRLRKVLQDIDATVEIHTIRGVGYMLGHKQPSPSIARG